MQRTRRLCSALALLAACKGHSGDAPAALDVDQIDAAAAADPESEGPSADASAAPASVPRAIVLTSPAPIFNATEWPPKDPEKAKEERKGVTKIGFLRKGARVPVKPDLIKKTNCPEGWFELVDGGFVCGKFLTMDEHHADLAHVPSQPNMSGPLPYTYAMNLTNGAPMYRRIPKRKEREEAEKGLLVGKSKPGDLERAQAAFKEEGSDVPWYLEDHQGQKPTVSFDDLLNKGAGIVAMRMVKGFYISIDGEAHGQSVKLWQTIGELYVNQSHMLVHKPVTEFEGVRLDAEGETRKLPLGWVLSPKAWKYRLSDDKTKMKRNEKVDRFSIVQLTGNKVHVENRDYFETADGWYLRDLDSTRTDPGPAPSDLGASEKWIDVNLKTQSLVAYEGSKPVYATILSSGKHDDTDKTKDHHTPAGNFAIREKYIASTMDDDAAGDGTYSITDVPWIMYFHGGYALHGAFWHSAFGHERSHGCINLTPFDAHNLFQWAGPRLPEGWHGVMASPQNPGTRVIVHN